MTSALSEAERLEPCPFCGGEMFLRPDNVVRHRGETHEKCPLLGTCVSAENWNRRALVEPPSEPEERIMGVHFERYGLAKEIYDGLKERGFWTPANWVGPDLIGAVAKALDETSSRASRAEAELDEAKKQGQIARDCLHEQEQDNDRLKAELEAAMAGLREINGMAKSYCLNPGLSGHFLTMAIDIAAKSLASLPAAGAEPKP